MSEKLWGGRFAAKTNAAVEAFSASIAVDGRMYNEDITASCAHARMLADVGVLEAEDVADIIAGLEDIRNEIKSGELELSPKLEDIHMNIEQRLTDKIGEAGKKLHTARSRNDQVATDTRLYLRHRVESLQKTIQSLQIALLEQAELHAETIMPGFTHLQTAQPVILGHHLLAYVEMLARDTGRFTDAAKRMNECPLGSAALAGTTFPINRDQTAKILGFSRPCANSLDAVSDRDFIIEILSAAALTATHLSRLSEELILWMSAPFAFIDLGDGFCTGSSIMPQKKNPDIPELVRGKTGRIVGALINSLILLKGLPLAYNRDMQEDKEAVFDALDTLEISLTLFAAMIPSMRVNKKRMLDQASAGFATATDLADMLVRAGISFREAHSIVGKAVAYCVQQDCMLEDMDTRACAAIDARMTLAMVKQLSPQACVAARNHYGATAPAQVIERCADWRDNLDL
ncbi:MAG: argininosuccinate lyase [Mariprofundales bacterium]